MKFSKTHEWVKIDSDGKTARIGISKKALEELGEIVFVQLPEKGVLLTGEQPMAVVESTKAAIDIYAPLEGVVHAVNEKLLEDIALLNSDPQGEGWLCEIEIKSPISDEHLMSETCYAQL